MHHPKQQDAERGQALAEFALTVPIFLMLVFGILDLARLVAGFTQVIDAARQGVRYGIVEGLDADIVQSLDCSGIEDRVRETPGLIPGDDLVIDISYRDPETDTELWNCTSGDPSKSLLNQDVVLQVTVTGAIAPMTPAIAIIDNSFDFDYTSERAITEGAYYTDEWPVGPTVPQNFYADVDCTTGRVKFGWDPMSDWPDRIEIRDSYTNATVASLDYPETQYSTCNDYDPTGRQPCGTNISTDGGSGMWYAVVIDNGMEGTSTSDDTANCDPSGPGGGAGGTVTVQIFAYEDLNRNGSHDAGEGPRPGLKVEIFLVGTKKDTSQGSVITDANGNATLTGTIPSGQSTATFRVHGTKPPGNMMLRPMDDIPFENLADGASASGSFGVGESH